jgi:hypothetical protein
VYIIHQHFFEGDMNASHEIQKVKKVSKVGRKIPGSMEQWFGEEGNATVISIKHLIITSKLL